MEQLNPFYEENLTETFLNLDQFSQGMSHSQVYQFMHKLLTTIDLSCLSDVFFEQLKLRLKIDAVKIQFGEQSLTLGSSNPQLKSKILSCQQHGKVCATIQYGFNRTLSASDWLILQQMHLYFSNPLKNALEHYKIKQFAMKDFLTSLGNRASYNDSLMRLISQAERHHSPFGLLVLDLDNFKQVNDQFGHPVGDKVLIAFTNLLLHCLRDTDFAFRFGGDEFCCLLPNTTIPTIKIIAERIRASVAADELLNQYKVSCSIGCAAYDLSDVPTQLFERADKALYSAKQNGRNCIKAA